MGRHHISLLLLAIICSSYLIDITSSTGLTSRLAAERRRRIKRIEDEDMDEDRESERERERDSASSGDDLINSLLSLVQRGKEQENDIQDEIAKEAKETSALHDDLVKKQELLKKHNGMIERLQICLQKGPQAFALPAQTCDCNELSHSLLAATKQLEDERAKQQTENIRFREQLHQTVNEEGQQTLKQTTAALELLRQREEQMAQRESKLMQKESALESRQAQHQQELEKRVASQTLLQQKLMAENRRLHSSFLSLSSRSTTTAFGASCSQHTDCASCSADHQCGWCGPAKKPPPALGDAPAVVAPDQSEGTGQCFPHDTMSLLRGTTDGLTSGECPAERWLSNVISRVSALTLNVFAADQRSQEKRIQLINSVIAKTDPTFIAFQEVEDWFAEAITKLEWYKHYSVSNAGQNTPHYGGLLILSKYPLSRVSFVSVHSTTGEKSHVLIAEAEVTALREGPMTDRATPPVSVQTTATTPPSLLEELANVDIGLHGHSSSRSLAEPIPTDPVVPDPTLTLLKPTIVNHDARSLTIATTCLDYSSKKNRIEGLDLLCGVLSNYQDVLLMGDFNLDEADSEESQHLCQNFVDLWPALNPTDPGHTWNPNTNAYAHSLEPDSRPARLDRMFFKSTHYLPRSIDLVGCSGWHVKCTDHENNKPVNIPAPSLLQLGENGEELAYEYFPSTHYGLLGHASLFAPHC